jgi:hypothetical protein
LHKPFSNPEILLFSGKRMASGGERANTTSYEEDRVERLRINKERLHQLIPSLAEKSLHEQNNKTKVMVAFQDFLVC